MSTPKPLILVVEDEKEMAQLISAHLEAANMVPQVFHRSENVDRFLERNFANLMLLDVNLPDQSGLHLLKNLREKDIEIPVIFVTGKDCEETKIKGLEMGADDYITKPFSLPELTARIHAILRRAETAHDHEITKNTKLNEKPFLFCKALICPHRMEIEYPNGKREKIGRKELGILDYLSSNPGIVVTRKELIHAVWGIHADTKSRSLDQYIVKIRNNFERQRCSLDAFQTIHGVGYIYETQSKISHEMRAPQGINTQAN
jgi:two-component system alkaline phosphatase synthesis response regulator PhoP